MKDLSAKKKIIEGTINCIEKYGLDSVTIRAIAKESDVTLSSVHYYFDSKEALLEISIQTAISGAFKDLQTIWNENANDVYIAVSRILTYLFDGAVKFPGITKAGLYPLIIQNKEDNFFMSGLNSFLEKISGDIALQLNMDCKEIKIGLTGIFSSILFLGMAPSSFHNFAGYSFLEKNVRKSYIDSILNKLFQN